jgi:hypothetical protein
VPVTPKYSSSLNSQAARVSRRVQTTEGRFRTMANCDDHDDNGNGLVVDRSGPVLHPEFFLTYGHGTDYDGMGPLDLPHEGQGKRLFVDTTSHFGGGRSQRNLSSGKCPTSSSRFYPVPPAYNIAE